MDYSPFIQIGEQNAVVRASNYSTDKSVSIKSRNEFQVQESIKYKTATNDNSRRASIQI